MGEIVNLRLVRKAKSKQLKDKVATQNRVEFGLSKHEKTVASRLADEAARKLDLLKIEGHHRTTQAKEFEP